MSCNHLGSYERAEAIVRAAAATGCDAIKLQTYTGDTITLNCDKPHFVLGHDGVKTQWGTQTLWKLFEGAHTPWEWFPKLQALAHSLNIDFFSSPFDHTAVDFLEQLDTPILKVASMECVDIPLLKKVAKTGKPVIMSTGMATIGEIEEAVRTLKSNGCKELAILKCTSAYPARPEDAHLNTIRNLASTFNTVVGLSDHTLTTCVPIASVALGGRIIEKHFILSREKDGGPDATFSLEPHEFKQMVEEVRTIEKSLGSVHYGGVGGEVRMFRRSIFVVKDMKKGENFLENINVRSIRPGNGLHSRHMEEIVGLTATRDIEMGEPLAWNMIQGD
eukprot:g6702.t1